MTGEQLPNDNRYPNMLKIQTSRLTSDNRELAKGLFIMMAEVFAEGCDHLSDDYLDRLLSREDFWAIAAFVGDEIVGGLTAHTLPMTRSKSSEIFIYDLAVREDQQRKGIGRQLMTALREAATAAGIPLVLVGQTTTMVMRLISIAVWGRAIFGNVFHVLGRYGIVPDRRLVTWRERCACLPVECMPMR